MPNGGLRRDAHYVQNPSWMSPCGTTVLTRGRHQRPRGPGSLIGQKKVDLRRRNVSRGGESMKIFEVLSLLVCSEHGELLLSLAKCCPRCFEPGDLNVPGKKVYVGLEHA